MGERIKAGLSFSFGELFDDIGRWFILGILLAGLITTFLSPVLIENYLGRGFFSMIIVLMVSVPLYVCATASTPVAAALALKGISPGAALVFLLAGPATNAASLTLVTRIIGRRAAGIYLAVIIVVSLLIGFAVNHLYFYLGMDIRDWVLGSGHETPGMFSMICSLLLLALIVKNIFKREA